MGGPRMFENQLEPGEMLNTYPELKKYAKTHQLCVLKEVIEIDVTRNGNAFAAQSRIVMKLNMLKEDDEDSIYMGVWDSPECKDSSSFTKEKFALTVLDEESKELKVKWGESRGMKKRFSVYLGKLLNIGESMSFKATMFLPNFYDVSPERKEEYFDLDIHHPTMISVVKIKLPEGLAIAKKSLRYLYEDDKPCPKPRDHVVKMDNYENRYIIAYRYLWPAVGKIYYLRWNWKRLLKKN